jgi:hypothetical protein
MPKPKRKGRPRPRTAQDIATRACQAVQIDPAELDALVADIPESAHHDELKGRPTKLTRTVARTIVEAISVGHYHETACNLARVTYTTFREWMRRAETGDVPFRYLAQAIQIAGGLNEDLHIRRVRAASLDPRNWTASMTALERRYPKRWGRADRERQNLPSVQVIVGVQLPGAPSRAELEPVTVETKALPASVSDSEDS